MVLKGKWGVMGIVHCQKIVFSNQKRGHSHIIKRTDSLKKNVMVFSMLPDETTNYLLG